MPLMEAWYHEAPSLLPAFGAAPVDTCRPPTVLIKVLLPTPVFPMSRTMGADGSIRGGPKVTKMMPMIRMTMAKQIAIHQSPRSDSDLVLAASKAVRSMRGCLLCLLSILYCQHPFIRKELSFLSLSGLYFLLRASTHRSNCSLQFSSRYVNVRPEISWIFEVSARSMSPIPAGTVNLKYLSILTRCSCEEANTDAVASVSIRTDAKSSSI